MSRRVISHTERAELEKRITKDLGETFDDIGLTTGDKGQTIGYSWDQDKGVLIAEKYSERGNVVEFYEIRPVVSYVGDGSFED